ncbi:MAG TPA: type I DNA topoisomerase, partial [Syntrophales bacterium]|nr:type I DNA topoisomerase [Syntrophales bacterium]
PTKVRTIRKYLGKDFDVLATMGHIKDLPEKKLGIDIEKAFEPTYAVVKAKKDTVTKLKKAANKAAVIYLAPDPDREGEAIAWHIAEEVDRKGKKVYRVLFNDLTRQTILNSLEHPEELNPCKYEAQKARRILDRLVGYQLSPLLWDKVKRGLSAGRVQSVAVRLICEREEEIRRFVSEEYWNIIARLEGKHPPAFDARLLRKKGKKIKVRNADEAAEITAFVRTASPVVEALETKETKRNPQPPFTTSKLQQEAFRHLQFSPKKTMTVAQRLYEGIDLGEEGPTGLITYMRTDSVRVADEALRDVRKFIGENYEASYLPDRPRTYKSRKTAQEAHEAIRPASTRYRPQDIRAYLKRDEFRLYQLIWNRFVASQMNPAVLDQTTIDVAAGPYLFRAQGSVMKFPGFTVLYTEGKDEGEENGTFGAKLPAVEVGETLALLDLTSEQKFTQPPFRFTEATLVRELEEKGIGRPSTYAAILSTIQEREYVRLVERRFHPTELGLLVNELLVKNFPRILDVSFTAALEEQLDAIEEGKRSRLDTLNSFYEPFRDELEKARADMRNVKKEELPTDLTCEKCGAPMVIKWGKNGRFLACSRYPECRNTKNFREDENGDIRPSEPETTDVTCDLCGKPMVVKKGKFGTFLGCSGYPECRRTMKTGGKGPSPSPETAPEQKETGVLCEKCGRPMILRSGRYGRFLGCSGYPECKGIRPLPTGVKCPEEGCTGELAEKRTKQGRRFYTCTRYPECKYTLWKKPVPEPCPRCGHPFLVETPVRGKGTVVACPREECGFRKEPEAAGGDLS